MTPALRAFEAQYQGWCPECLEHYPPGTTVVRLMNGKIVHEKCPEPLTLKNEVCSSCFQEKSNTGKCGCE